MSSVRSRPTPPFVLMVPNSDAFFLNAKLRALLENAPKISTGKNKFATALSSALPVLYEIVKRRCYRVPRMWFVAVSCSATAPDRLA